MKYHPTFSWYQKSSALLCFALNLLLIAEFGTATPLATVTASIDIHRDHDQAQFISTSNPSNSSALDSRMGQRHDEQLLQTCSCTGCTSSGTASPTSSSVLSSTCPTDYDAIVIRNFKISSSNGGIDILGLDPTNYALYQQGSTFSQFSGISAQGVTCFNQGSAVGGVTGQTKMYFVVRCTNLVQSCPFTYSFSATCSAITPSGGSSGSSGSSSGKFQWWWLGFIPFVILVVYIRRRIWQACMSKPEIKETPQNPPSTAVPVQPSAVVLTVREPTTAASAESYKRFCGGCGAENSGSKFCGSCGQKL
jgi:hypothetical protein